MRPMSSASAKDVFDKMYVSGRGAKEIVASEGLVQLTDESAIEEVARAVVAANPSQAEKFRQGNDKLLGFFVGQVMKQTGGKANPEAANRILRKLLGP